MLLPDIDHQIPPSTPQPDAMEPKMLVGNTIDGAADDFAGCPGRPMRLGFLAPTPGFAIPHMPASLT
jgi:hypothetical protein